MNHPTIASALVAGILLTATAPADAAPARTGSLPAAPSQFAWDGAALNGVAADSSISDTTGCVPVVAECDDTLLKVDAAGTLSVKIGDGSTGAADLDLYVYASDASGTVGTFRKSSTGSTADESTSFDADPGYYLVRVKAATAAQGTYKGTAKLDPAPEDVSSAPPVTPTTPPAANQPPTTVITPPRGRHVTKITGIARDDSAVATVAVGLVQIKGRKCYGLTASGSFARLAKCTAPTLLPAKGTTTWTLKLRHALPKAKYVAYATATDDAGISEGGFGPKNRVAFTVR